MPWIVKEWEFDTVVLNQVGINMKLSFLDYYSIASYLMNGYVSAVDASNGYFERNIVLKGISDHFSNSNNTLYDLRERLLEDIARPSSLYFGNRNWGLHHGLLYMFDSMGTWLVGQLHMPHGPFIEKGAQSITFEFVYKKYNN